MNNLLLEIGIEEEMLTSLETQGFFLKENFVNDQTAKDLRSLMDLKYEEDAFNQAGVGKGQNFQINEKIRSDSILWLERKPENPVLKAYSEYIDSIIPLLARYFFLVLKDKELMFAIYDEGNFYTKHRDRFESNQHRWFTVILYLTDWAEGDGGELKLYTDDVEHIIKPKAGNFLIFNSELEHEVLVAHKRRYSITGWITDIPIGLGFLD